MKVIEITYEPILDGRQESFVINVLSHLKNDDSQVNLLTSYYCNNELYDTFIAYVQVLCDRKYLKKVRYTKATTLAFKMLRGWYTEHIAYIQGFTLDLYEVFFFKKFLNCCKKTIQVKN